MQGLGPRIRWLRAGTTLDQAAFAQGIGVQAGTVSAWENGDNAPYRSSLKLLAAFVGVPEPELAAFLAGDAKLQTIPLQMRQLLDPPATPITERLSPTTIAELKSLLDGSEGGH